MSEAEILLLGNGGVKDTRTYNEDDTLRGYVLTLQKFEKLLKQGIAEGTVTIIKIESKLTRNLKYENSEYLLAGIAWRNHSGRESRKQTFLPNIQSY